MRRDRNVFTVYNLPGDPFVVPGDLERPWSLEDPVQVLALKKGERLAISALSGEGVRVVVEPALAVLQAEDPGLAAYAEVQVRRIGAEAKHWRSTREDMLTLNGAEVEAIDNENDRLRELVAEIERSEAEEMTPVEVAYDRKKELNDGLKMHHAVAEAISQTLEGAPTIPPEQAAKDLGIRQPPLAPKPVTVLSVVTAGLAGIIFGGTLSLRAFSLDPLALQGGQAAIVAGMGVFGGLTMVLVKSKVEGLIGKAAFLRMVGEPALPTALLAGGIALGVAAIDATVVRSGIVATSVVDAFLGNAASPDLQSTSWLIAAAVTSPIMASAVATGHLYGSREFVERAIHERQVIERQERISMAMRFEAALEATKSAALIIEVDRQLNFEREHINQLAGFYDSSKRELLDQMQSLAFGLTDQQKEILNRMAISIVVSCAKLYELLDRHIGPPQTTSPGTARPATREGWWSRAKAWFRGLHRRRKI